MLGKKSSVGLLRKMLLHEGVPADCVVTTAFHQGSTRRWGLAWTFSAYLAAHYRSRHHNSTRAVSAFAAENCSRLNNFFQAALSAFPLSFVIRTSTTCFQQTTTNGETRLEEGGQYGELTAVMDRVFSCIIACNTALSGDKFVLVPGDVKQELSSSAVCCAVADQETSPPHSTGYELTITGSMDSYNDAAGVATSSQQKQEDSGEVTLELRLSIAADVQQSEMAVEGITYVDPLALMPIVV